MVAENFIESARSNPVNAALLKRLPELALPQCYLTAGCLFQTLWNLGTGLAPTALIKDYDVFYFDESDLSWEAEDRVIKRVQFHFSYLGISIEVKNQARVHCWYERRFGKPYPQLTSTTDGIDRYLIACTCVGVEVETGRVYAPNGLEDLQDGILRMNPVNGIPALFLEKALSYQARWPWLTIIQPDRAFAT